MAQVDQCAARMALLVAAACQNLSDVFAVVPTVVPHRRRARRAAAAHRDRPGLRDDPARRPTRSRPDGRSVLLVDTDSRRPGVQREVRYEITPAEPIAVIRTQGADVS
jgi:hypothetical protein